jgi:NAD(P)-dependent dehydrogenase (short-subunit alcohol dehydrogenase family)
MKQISDLMSLKGRCALITGATGAIGREIAFTIAELGGDLILVDKPGSEYNDLMSVLNRNFDINTICIDCDLENEDEREELILNVSRMKESLNIIINNAAFVGSSDLDGWISEFNNQTIDSWRRALEVNLTAVFDLSKGLASKLKASKSGVIINISSIYGSLGPDYSLYEGTEMGNPAAYSVSKGGLIQLTRWLSTTLAPCIRVNTISPGGVFRNQSKEFIKRYEARVPMKRMATEEDLKGIVAYLSSDLSKYVTGQNFMIDGGFSVW